MRITAIEGADLSVFEFDYDLTFMVFFISADERIYGRYGGRDSKNAERRQSLAGLRYAMAAAMESHRDAKTLATEERTAEPIYVRKLAAARNYTGCIHCHHAKEILYEELEKTGEWTREMIFRYPLPDNLGMVLEVDRGNVVKRVEADAPAAEAGLRTGDVIRELNGRSVFSLGDAQFALDKAPSEGNVSVVWLRDGEVHSGMIRLPQDWRRSDVSWRPSMYNRIGSARLYGKELTAAEKAGLGLSPTAMAFRQKEKLAKQARVAGVRPGDIILGFNDERLELDGYEFLRHVRSRYVVGDKVIVNLIRDGKRVDLPMTFMSNSH